MQSNNTHISHGMPHNQIKVGQLVHLPSVILFIFSAAEAFKLVS
jgi:hypothetical protein